MLRKITTFLSANEFDKSPAGGGSGWWSNIPSGLVAPFGHVVSSVVAFSL